MSKFNEAILVLGATCAIAFTTFMACFAVVALAYLLMGLLGLT